MYFFVLCANKMKVTQYFLHITVTGDEDSSPVLPDTPTRPAVTRSSTSDSDDSTPLPPSATPEEEEGSSQDDDDIMNVSTASSLGEELPVTPIPHPQEVEDPEWVCPDSCAKTGSSSKSCGKSNTARTDFLRAMFSKKNNFSKDDIAKKAPAVTSLIPARNSPRKIETREV